MTLKASSVQDAQVHARDRQTSSALLQLLGLEEIETFELADSAGWPAEREMNKALRSIAEAASAAPGERV